jgi:Pyridoxamine 5'-phosphate oxidase
MASLIEQIRSIVARGSDMTVATVRPDGWPQATTVSYASDGLTIYFGTDTNSPKARNIAKNNRVSLTINLPYSDWNHIEGISASGFARRVTEPSEVAHFSAAMLAKFPDVVKYLPPDGAGSLAMFRIDLKFVSVLDYTKGFGHTEHTELSASA